MNPRNGDRLSPATLQAIREREGLQLTREDQREDRSVMALVAVLTVTCLMGACVAAGFIVAGVGK